MVWLEETWKEFWLLTAAGADRKPIKKCCKESLWEERAPASNYVCSRKGHTTTHRHTSAFLSQEHFDRCSTQFGSRKCALQTPSWGAKLNLNGAAFTYKHKNKIIFFLIILIGLNFDVWARVRICVRVCARVCVYREIDDRRMDVTSPFLLNTWTEKFVTWAARNEFRNAVPQRGVILVVAQHTSNWGLTSFSCSRTLFCLSCYLLDFFNLYTYIWAYYSTLLSAGKDMNLNLKKKPFDAVSFYIN